MQRRKHRPRDRPMTDCETALTLIGVLLICLVGVAVYIFRA